MNADSVSPLGLNHDHENGRPVSDDPDLASAAMAKTTRRTIWKPTRMNCTRSVVVMPRYATKVAMAKNAKHVTTLTRRFSHSVEMLSLPVISPMNW